MEPLWLLCSSSTISWCHCVELSILKRSGAVCVEGGQAKGDSSAGAVDEPATKGGEHIVLGAFFTFLGEADTAC